MRFRCQRCDNVTLVCVDECFVSRPRASGGQRGFTLIELLVVIAIIGILAALLLPTLSKSKTKTKAVQCLNDLRQIELASKMYSDDNHEVMIPLWMEQGAPGANGWTYDAATFLVQWPNRLWWPDKLRLDSYLKNAGTYNCPMLTQPATATVGGSASQNYPLGIGMNYPEFGWLVAAADFSYPIYAISKENGVAAPSQCIVFGDAAMISNPGEADADRWQEIPATGCAYFRVPSDTEGYPRKDSRTIPRHDGLVNVVFFDGHAAKIRNSSIGYERPRTDSANLWARNYNGLTP
ncbi:MAG TPA: prepilin-type N-terminal cleavage/methylation domain-containing protein [Verrucomicrobiae bacterium]|nr:prepilin-type N-terminal cleavage/methylation domain-containing protein [Verrucomicrobiae bacterium]